MNKTSRLGMLVLAISSCTAQATAGSLPKEPVKWAPSAPAAPTGIAAPTASGGLATIAQQNSAGSAAATASDKAPSAQPAAATKPIDALSWVIGGVWTADASKLAPGMQRIETRYQWSDNHAYIRFTTHFVFDKGTVKNYDGSFFWNPATKNLALWYMDTQNTITESSVQIDGNQWTMQFRGEDFAEKMADLRVVVTRKTGDDYSWSLSEKQGDTWMPLMALEYLRLPEK
jgi:hypothetical protein